MKQKLILPGFIVLLILVVLLLSRKDKESHVDEFDTASLLQPINLYQEPDKNSVASQIDVGSDLTFIKTDNINWCQVRLEDGLKVGSS